MTGIIFAAGIGSRLKPFTDHHPKALATVGGKPLLLHVAERLLNAGCDRIIVNVHHFPEQIVDFLAAQSFRDKITISDESELLLDTAGALAKIWREHPELAESAEPIIVHNADIYTDVDLVEMIECHKNAGAEATLLADPARHSTRHLLFDDKRQLKGWENTATHVCRPAGTNPTELLACAFGGIHVLNPPILSEISEDLPAVLAPVSITDWYIDNCRTTKINVYIPDKPYTWHDVGTPEKLAAANAAANIHH